MNIQPNLRIQRLVNIINNLPCSGADIHKRANLLCVLINCYKPSTREDLREKSIKNAEEFIEDFFKQQLNKGA